ncbi:MAG: hypothetical protein MJ198_03070 [Bacteroidales bacterium]|nr:hypothetical protein [Bacteroidales bacterium]
MKKYCIAIAAVMFGLSSCKHVQEPESADFAWYLKADYEKNILDLSKANANPSTIELSDVLYFVAKSNDANSYVVWTGEPGHNYLERDLTKEQIKDTVNNAGLRATGLALSSKSGLGNYYKTYNYSTISEVGNPFQVYCTARNYDYETGEYAEVKAGPFSITVIDTQTDLWDDSDPYNSAGATNYDITFKFGSKKVNKSTSGKNGSYEIIYESEGTKPGIKVTYPKGAPTTGANVIFKAKNCIPFSENGTMTYNVKFGTYTWEVDLSSPQILVLASQSAVAAGYADYMNLSVGDEGVDSKGYVICSSANDLSKIAKPEYSREYEFTAVEYAE